VSLPEPVAALVADLAEIPGAVAVVLGGSRATTTHRPDSDWDIGLYYRGSQRSLDPEDVRRLGYEGYVSALGAWGPIVDGGAWLTIDRTPVDVLFRDLDVVEGWIEEAEHGRYEELMQNGYIVGAPTYIPVGELALCQPIVGNVPRPRFPQALAASAAKRWQGRASTSLMFANMHARLGDAVCCAGMLVDAVLCAAHGRLAQRCEWVLNEKRLVDRAGLQDTQPLLARPGSTSDDLLASVALIGAALQIEPLTDR
jgi:predicted nucleotidyltransferase